MQGRVGAEGLSMVPAAATRYRIGLLFGGRSPEHEISITTAASIAKEADPTRIDVVPIYISREGRWLRLAGSGPLALLAGRLATEQDIADLKRQEVILSGADRASLVSVEDRRADPERIDALFPALHGQGGEDGSVQGLARLADLPCVGAGILGSALGMDKVSMKRIAASEGIPVPSFVGFTREEWAGKSAAIRDAIWGKLQPPVFVKPSGAGSSVGITKVGRPSDLDDAVREAGRYDYRLIVEQGIDGREMEVGLLGNDEPEASVVGEIIPSREFYDYRDKYYEEASRVVIPADIPREIADRIRGHAIAAFRALDLSGMARADFLLERETGAIYFNEVNTIPGFTPISMYPMLWRASGVTYRDLITRLVELAVGRHRSTRVEAKPPPPR